MPLQIRCTCSRENAPPFYEVNKALLPSSHRILIQALIALTVKVNGRSIQAAALGYISNLSRITYLLSKRNLEIFDRFVNQSSTSGPTMHTPKACAGKVKVWCFLGQKEIHFACEFRQLRRILFPGGQGC